MLLEKEGLIKITAAGSSKLCEFSGEFDRKIYETESERQKDLFRNKDFLILKNRLSELNFTFIALLFGSYAKGIANKHSDIDILTIGGDEKEIKTAISLLPDKIHLTCITYDNFIHMAKSKEFTVVSETIKNNIILIGIEEYYRLIKNAQ
jgi:predicted nucleotidyltransferase